MPDEKICGQCKHFYAIKIPAGTDSFKETDRGSCLALSVYAKNKPGNPVFPPNAKTAELPFARHDIVIVQRKQKMPHCATFQKKGEHK